MQGIFPCGISSRIKSCGCLNPVFQQSIQDFLLCNGIFPECRKLFWKTLVAYILIWSLGGIPGLIWSLPFPEHLPCVLQSGGDIHSSLGGITKGVQQDADQCFPMKKVMAPAAGTFLQKMKCSLPPVMSRISCLLHQVCVEQTQCLTQCKTVR